MIKGNLLVLLELKDDEMARLRELAGQIPVVYCPQQGDCTQQMVDEAAIIWGNVPIRLLHEQPGLRWLQIKNAGAESYCAPGLLCRETVLTNGTGAYSLNLSEHMLGLLLMLMKHLPLHYDRQKERRWVDGWSEQRQVKYLQGSSVLVVGLGDIGGALARKVHLLGAGRVMGVRRTPRPMDGVEVYPLERLDELLPQADVVILSLPHNDQSQKLMDERRLGLCKPGALLLNCGRGTAVDSLALCRALESGRLDGAALDVTDPEPLPPDHPLWTAPNCLITPHCAGDSYLESIRSGVVEIALDNLARFLTGQPMKNVIAR